MLDKFKIASVLLIIGMLSGLSIWGTHALTEERINLNRERARLAVYVDMFPDMDVEDGMVHEVIENSVIYEKITIYDRNGNLLGYAMLGKDNNAHGHIEAVVGIDASADIVDVVITNTENTPTYVSDAVEYLANLRGQPLNDVAYDTNTGATQTYNSVRSMVEASVLLIEGDPVLDAYGDLIDTVDRYAQSFEFMFGAARVEVELFDGANTIVGYSYVGDIRSDDTEYRVGVVIDSNNVFKGFAVLEEDSVEALDNAIEAFAGSVDESIDGLDFEGSNPVEDQLAELANVAFMRVVEDEDTRAMRQYFLDASRLGDEALLDDAAPLVSVRSVYDAEDTLLGYVYYAEAEGYAMFDYDQPIELDIVIDVDGNVASIVVVDHRESAGFSDPAFEGLDVLYGESSVDVYTQEDVYTGGTVTGNAIRGAVRDALEDASERIGE